jgi:hypothetical protein
MYTGAAAMTGCESAIAGEYAPLPDDAATTSVGPSLALKCVKMTFTDLPGQPTCKSCPDGKYNTVEGSTTCETLRTGLEVATTQFVHVSVAIDGLTIADFGVEEEQALKEAIVQTLREASPPVLIDAIDIVNINVDFHERRLSSARPRSRRLAEMLHVDFDITLPQGDEGEGDDEANARLAREAAIATAMGSSASGSSASAFEENLVTKIISLDPGARTGTVTAAVEEAEVQARVELMCQAGSVISAPSPGLESCSVCEAGTYADADTCTECANKGAGALLAEEYSDEGAAVCRKCMSVLTLRTDGQCYIHVIIVFVLFLVVFISICCCCRYFSSGEKRELMERDRYTNTPKSDLHRHQQQKAVPKDRDAVAVDTDSAVRNPMAHLPPAQPYNEYASERNSGLDRSGSGFVGGNPGASAGLQLPQAGRQNDAAQGLGQADRPRAKTAAQELAKRRNKPTGGQASQPPPPDTPYHENTDFRVASLADDPAQAGGWDMDVSLTKTPSQFV